MRSLRFLAVLLVAASGLVQAAAAGVRIKDIARVQSMREHALVGYGLVTGLAGTGDSSGNRGTRQTLANLLARFGITLPAEAVASRNVAAVMVSAALPNYVKAGDSIDVTVTSIGDARSLAGGDLLLAPLRAPNGKVYVLAQGPLTVGGYRYEANGTVGQKNHPTVATIPAGGIVEVAPPAPDTADASSFVVTLLEPDYTNAGRVADAINTALDGRYARAPDPDSVVVQIPDAYRGRFVDLVRRIEPLEITADFRARVVVNERTGTVVSGAAVRIAPVSISYGDLRISITSDNTVSQPSFIADPGSAIRTQGVSNSKIDLDEPAGAHLVTREGGSIADLMQALARIHTNSRDVVSILKALKASGALHAELVVQ